MGKQKRRKGKEITTRKGKEKKEEKEALPVEGALASARIFEGN